jgi:hypothetical protein
MKKVTITIVPSLPVAEAELAMREWTRAHPDVCSRLEEGALEVTFVRGCAENGRVIAKRMYRLTLDEADAALVERLKP